MTSATEPSPPIRFGLVTYGNLVVCRFPPLIVSHASARCAERGFLHPKPEASRSMQAWFLNVLHPCEGRIYGDPFSQFAAKCQVVFAAKPCAGFTAAPVPGWARREWGIACLEKGWSLLENGPARGTTRIEHRCRGEVSSYGCHDDAG